MERETRFELATLALARRCSTTELLPHVLVPGRRASPSRSLPGHREQLTGIEPVSPVWKTGMSAEFTRAASPVRGLNPVFRIESPVVYLPQPHGRFRAFT